ncbi:glycosyltransferase family A protein [Brevundimonas sp.]|uniref:glycosyltransferase family 2 protein n=1 Tax=Brevundimonas sp. TaxID=1871086 RepID=UPI001AD215E1|nr:glycosyltransferase family A protein [Brevundimonas sp.]MBN9464465.1 glycosyltransferase family 2 protein [Brevundimonas sp.]
MSVDISVVILSYDRVHLLERTLRGCARQGGDWGRFEIIVVDNHPEELARPLVGGLAAETGVAMTYLADPRRNISIVRNKGIAAATGRYVAFIDDDEEPQPNWLAELTACLDRTGADAAFGPKLPEFEGGRAPDWDPRGWRYTLDFQMAADEEIHIFGRLRKRGKGLGSGNAAFRVATCLSGPEPFSVAFGNANGEDTQLLFRLAMAGRRFVWCPDAVVHEFIEQSRARPDYMVTRMKRGSQHYAVCRIDTSANKPLTTAKVALLGLAQMAVHAGLYVVSGEFLDREHRYDHRIGMAKGLGKLTWTAPIGFIEEKAA